MREMRKWWIRKYQEKEGIDKGVKEGGLGNVDIVLDEYMNKEKDG